MSQSGYPPGYGRAYSASSGDKSPRSQLQEHLALQRARFDASPQRMQASQQQAYSQSFNDTAMLRASQDGGAGGLKAGFTYSGQIEQGQMHGR
eukprot:CAMPEP_0175960094 /NCGR_PEP_ID=MMETSP0108-20121206/35172_1 /TAXON_ID=195067 ORGANISM="Goniomonas pacifica, Strain CCMP1869" /NCGR_SAMPLE_ID=MMETSP0108 /ASSEMBLY_ACC=CAM_ASM_000204 /LENGTH=92 /DNA_ID=CAMNT_0017287641 /DNA_START=16 /DNA_END=290 /DNA_ORIENTATION=+